MRTALLLVLVAALTAAADEPKDDKIKEALKKLQGTWVVDSSEAEGENETRDLGLEFIFDGDKLTVQNPQGGATQKFTCKVDPSTTPKAIDITRTEDKYTFLYVYEIKGDTLKLCLWKAQPKQRATEFKGGEEHWLLILKRPKP